MKQIRLKKIDKRKIHEIRDIADLKEYINIIYSQFGKTYDDVIRLSKKDHNWYTRFYWTEEQYLEFQNLFIAKHKGYKKRRLKRQLPWVMLGFGPTSVLK